MSHAEVSRSYKYGKCQLTLRFGDLTKSDAQVLVSSDDYYLSMGGGVSAAILDAGGTAIALDAAKRVPATLGNVVVTTAGSLPAQYIFHAVTIGPPTENLDQRDIVRQTTRRCLQLLATLNLSSIAFPAIGSGAARFRFEDVASEMAQTICDEVSKFERAINVTVYLFDRYGKMTQMDFLRFFEECAARVSRLTPVSTGPASAPDAQPSPPTGKDETSWQDIRSRRLHWLSKLVSSLEENRMKIEENLISALADGDDARATTARDKLRQNEELRLGYHGELRALRSDTTEHTTHPVRPKTVFVSSTYKDLVQHREAAKDQISRRDLLFRGMEHFGADPQSVSPSSKIVAEVRNADVYLGMFGVRYGSVDSATGVSMTDWSTQRPRSATSPCCCM